ncbi:MAG: hypothetical protein Q9227_008039 [Pyrenula ochraceoflavens]
MIEVFSPWGTFAFPFSEPGKKEKLRADLVEDTEQNTCCFASRLMVVNKARLQLPFRHTLDAAADAPWKDVRQKLLPAKVWASPDKPDGYLRKSVLLDLAEKIGDIIPQELVNAGTFKDPATSNRQLDEAANLDIPIGLWEQKEMRKANQKAKTDDTIEDSEADEDEEMIDEH